MNASEYAGLKEILNRLNTEELLSVMGTTTKHLVKAETREEAIQVIIEYSPRASTILRRKKITRNILFEYLHDHGKHICPSAEKPHLINVCLKLWVSNDSQQNCSLNDIEENSKGETSPVSTQVPPSDVASNVNVGSVSELGLRFAKWFFDALNLQDNFGAQHFWPDCKFWLHSKVGGMKEEEDFCIMGSNNVSSHLSHYITSKRYFFKPNATETGVKTMAEEHGLVKVSVSGVIHRFSNCIGLFDFVFGLVCDPVFNDNWKIKQLALVIQVNSVQRVKDHQNATSCNIYGCHSNYAYSNVNVSYIDSMLKIS